MAARCGASDVGNGCRGRLFGFVGGTWSTPAGLEGPWRAAERPALTADGLLTAKWRRLPVVAGSECPRSPPCSLLPPNRGGDPGSAKRRQRPPAAVVAPTGRPWRSSSISSNAKRARASSGSSPKSSINVQLHITGRPDFHFFEGHTCPLAKRGHSRDRKRGSLQIVFGLLCTASGCPIAVEVFEGSTGDPKTVAAQVDKIRNRFGLQRVVLVGDRGMLTAARIREDLQGVDGLRWITTLRAPTIRKLIAAGEVAQTMFDERDLAEISSPEFRGERLIVCRNPILADQRQRKRQELLAATEEKLMPIVKATQRAKDPLCGAAAIGVRVGKVINHRKVGKHFITTITDDSFSFKRDLDKIAAEEELDGLYIVRSNVEPELFDAAQTVRAYKDLAKAERAFRSMKTVDLKVRPIYHRSADRVRAHVLLCMLAYYVEWHMRSKLAPLLFDDHDRAAGEQMRESVVQPAQRSPAAHRKASSKRTDDDLPVHSFRSLMSDLGTLVVNDMQPAEGGGTFSLSTQPTPVQRRCFEFLEVSPRM